MIVEEHAIFPNLSKVTITPPHLAASGKGNNVNFDGDSSYFNEHVIGNLVE